MQDAPRGTAATTSATARFEGHTPGPWRNNGVLIETANGIALEIAGVRVCRVGNAPKSGTEILANARLIAAAPNLLAEAADLRKQRDELLLALRKAHHCIKNGVCFDYEGMQQVGYRTEWDQEADKLADDAAAVIARVEAA